MKKQTKRTTALAGATALLLAPIWALPAQAAPDGSDVVINEVYARGGSSGQPYTHKFVELYNPTDEAISLDGVSLQYFPAGSASPNFNLNLSAYSIEADGYLLIQGGSNGSAGVALSEPDVVANGLSPQGSNASLALVDGTASLGTMPGGNVNLDERIIDFVGYGTANKWEGLATATYPGGNGDPGSISRTNGVDTDDNAADFTFSSTPTPQNSGGTGTDPEEPGEPTDPEDITPIAEIQGTGAATPLNGQRVTTNGVVTAAYPSGGYNGFYLQTAGTGSEIGDASHGIFVYMGSGAGNVEVGDYVEVTGTAGEFNNLTQISGSPTVTQLEDVVEAPTPVAVTEADLLSEAGRERLEGMIIDFSEVDLTVTDTYNTNQYAEVALALGDAPLATSTDIYNPVTEKAAHDDLVADNTNRMLVLDDASTVNYMTNAAAKKTPIPYLNRDVPVRVGAAVEFEGNVVLDYRNNFWKIQPTETVTGDNDDFAVFEDTRADVQVAPEVAGDVTISTFNVLNYFVHLGEDEPGCRAYTDREGNPIAANNCNVRGAFTPEAFENQEGKIVAAIQELDSSIVGLEEIENSRKFGADRDLAVETLVDALNDDAGFEKWAYAESPSQVTSLADEDFIRLAFIYQVDDVVPTEDSKILIGNSAFGNAREPLGQAWQALNSEGEPSGEEFATIINHFKSKGSGTDDGTGQGNANPDRKAQAEALLDFADAQYGDVAVFLLGDFNSYSAEDPLRIFEADGYTNLLREKSVADDTHYYTYSFSRNVGSLDHIFASEDAHEWVAGTEVWNINSVEAIALEYSRYNYNVTDLFEPGTPFRSSDHDPIKVGLNVPGFEDVEPVIEVTPVAPTFADNVITIPVVEGVEYLINDEVVTGDIAITEDTDVAAQATEGYVIAEGATTEWTFEYVDTTVEVTPVAPTFADNVITIPVVEGVEYLINYEVVTGDIAITEDTDVAAQATEGYVIAEGATTEWTFEYVAPPVTPDPIPNGNVFLISDSWSATQHGVAFAYGRVGDEVYAGDWDADGDDTLAVRRGNEFFVNNELRGGKADTTFKYGRVGDEVLVGDWDGDGFDTFGVRRGHTFYLNNTLTGGNADVEFKYGRNTDEVLVGDWDGNEVDTITVRRDNVFHVNDNLLGGNAQVSFAYGRSTDEAYAGDFDGDGIDTITLRRGNQFIVNNDLLGGSAGTRIGFGRASDNVLIGDWNGDGIDTVALNRIVR